MNQSFSHKRVFCSLISLLFLVLFTCCTFRKETSATLQDDTTTTTDKIKDSIIEQKELTANDIEIVRNLLYDKHTLDDQYEYKDTFRTINTKAIAEQLAFIENMQREPIQWAVIQNYKNLKGEPPVVKSWHRNEYNLVTDDYEVSRYQSIPLYAVGDSVVPERYGRDGSPIQLIDSIGRFFRIHVISIDGEWLTPKKYVKVLSDNPTDSILFDKVAVIDRDQQNIISLKRKTKGHWEAMSVNPCTTGRHKPPYAHETPLGIYVVQDKKEKMYYRHDGKSTIAGYAPFATRFTNGAYLHGVPTQDPNAHYQEWSWSLGTTPRSHMCVRLASSHAEFLFKELNPYKSLVVVIGHGNE